MFITGQLDLRTPIIKRLPAHSRRPILYSLQRRCPSTFSAFTYSCHFNSLIQVEDNHPKIGGGLALDAFWPDSTTRLAASVDVRPTNPAIAAIAVEQRMGNGVRWFGEAAPTGRVGAGCAFYSRYFALGTTRFLRFRFVFGGCFS